MIWVGTSGYNYPAWRGRFYPPGLPAAEMLSYYAARFACVEINATFYQWPTPAMLSGWAAATPEHFRLALKVPRRVTHHARLRGVGAPLRGLQERAQAALGAKLAPFLFRLPEDFLLDLPTLDAFLADLPPTLHGAVEFRNTSWHTQAVFDRLRAHNLALCISDSDWLTTPLERTADFGYFRLRDEGYQEADLARWAEVIRAWQPAGNVYVFFKHEDQAKGPRFANRLLELLGQAATPLPTPSPA
jgi:uncharacterized protein YecE (DUF72 family)